MRNPHIGCYREKEKTLGNVGRGEDEDMERLRGRNTREGVRGGVDNEERREKKQ